MLIFLWGSIIAIFSHYGFGIQLVGLLIFMISMPVNTITYLDPSYYSLTTFSIDIGVWVAILSTAIGAVSYIVVWGQSGREKVFIYKPA